LKKKIKITKASGAVEDLNPDKLRASLTRSGADRETAEDVIERVLYEIEPYSSTKKIYRLARKYLRQYNHATGLRYSLKKALLKLGPTGYPFERYYGELLKHYGYKTDTGVILEGRCVNHEVDVYAVNDSEIFTVECKYHNRTGAPTDIKVAMYVYARFRDLGHAFNLKEPGKTYKGWLVTNTRFTQDAIDYSRCMGFYIRSWGYPEDDSLEKMIEDKRLYPVTVISGLKSGLARKLISQNIILLKDLVAIDVKDIKKMLSLTENKASLLKQQADELCLC
jgi:hypothetical protein